VELTTDAEVDVDRCLEQIRLATDALVATVRAAPPSAWDAPTACDPWRVRDVVVHLVTGGARFVASIDAGLRGSLTPGGDDERARQQTELEHADPDLVLGALEVVTGEFAARYHGLDDAALRTVCFHRRGNRSVRWYAAHRLAEVAFHAGDVQDALGGEATLPHDAARLVLPTLVESNLPRTYAAGASPGRGAGERYAFTVEGTSSAWTVQLDPDAMVVERGVVAPDLTITTTAEAMALLLYGRRALPALVRDGRAAVEGAPSLVDRFGVVFPRP
jgi:uncharacterized protein (TIGR03083 family)